MKQYGFIYKLQSFISDKGKDGSQVPDGQTGGTMDGHKKKIHQHSHSHDIHSNKSSDHEDLQPLDEKKKLQNKQAHRLHRHDKKLFIIYPEDTWKSKWDILMSLVLILSCLTTPIELAFFEETTKGWRYSNISIDIMFFLDIIVIFNTAYYNQDFILIDQRSLIAKQYLTGWFSIDLLAILPFNFFL